MCFILNLTTYVSTFQIRVAEIKMSKTQVRVKIKKIN